MTLSKLFRVQAVIICIYAALFFVAPHIHAQGNGWIFYHKIHPFGHVLAIPLFALGLFSWMAPSWVGNNLKKVGMIFGVYINLALVAIQLFQISTGAEQFYPGGMIPALILAALFFWKTRATS